MTPSEPSSPTPRPPLSPRLLRVASMADPATLAHRLTKGRFRIPPHLSLLSKEVAKAVRTGGRLLVMMPPRHGKSETVSVWGPVWFLNAWPDRRVMLASYEADFAAGWGRRARNLIDEHQDELLVRLSQDSTAANRWNTPEGGGMTTAGAGGAITGRGADLLIIDDAHKNAEEAYSQAHRDRVWEWWTTTALTRLEPGAAVVVVGTRWHEDDLIGRILAQDGEPWTVVRLPALALEGDPVGRAPGEALWPDRYDVAALERTRRSVGERAWEALYQQNPFGEGGGFFQRRWFEARYDVVAPLHYRLPDGTTLHRDELGRYATVDLAVSTRTSADYTVAAVVGRTRDGRRLLLHVDRARREGPDQVPALRRLVEAWGLSTVWIERTAFQLAIVQAARRAGLPVRELEPDRDKVARALPLTVELEAGRLLLPRRAPWLDALLAELLAFPAGAHDDQVDALAYAVAVRHVGMPDDLAAVGEDDDDDWRPTERDLLFASYCPNPPPGWEQHESYELRRARRWLARRGGW